MRLGTLYRNELINSFNINFQNKKVLDIGCFDGYLLSNVSSDSKIRIGVDLYPERKFNSISYIKANALFLPFNRNVFDLIFALDVIEHIQNDFTFTNEISKLITKNGCIYMSTPSKDIELYPKFLTKKISLKWGHYYRLGYTREEIIHLFEKNSLSVEIDDWNAYAYRKFYPPLKLFNEMFPILSKRIIKKIFDYDKEHKQGSNGFLIIKAYLRS